MRALDLTDFRPVDGGGTVLRRSGRSGGAVTWLCRCDCGREFVSKGKSLIARRRIDCGCLRAKETGVRVRARMVEK